MKWRSNLSTNVSFMQTDETQDGPVLGVREKAGLRYRPSELPGPKTRPGVMIVRHGNDQYLVQVPLVEDEFFDTWVENLDRRVVDVVETQHDLQGVGRAPQAEDMTDWEQQLFAGDWMSQQTTVLPAIEVESVSEIETITIPSTVYWMTRAALKSKSQEHSVEQLIGIAGSEDMLMMVMAHLGYGRTEIAQKVLGTTSGRKFSRMTDLLGSAANPKRIVVSEE